MTEKKVSITPLATRFMVGEVPKVSVQVIPTLEAAVCPGSGARVGSWARNRFAVTEAGHALFQKLMIKARDLDQWRHIDDSDPSRHMTNARNWVMTVYGGSTWSRIEAVLDRCAHHDHSDLGEIQVVENHAESDPTKTRLSLCGSDVVTWVAAALLNLQVYAWVGFSAVRHDVPRFNNQPSMTGLTAELARCMH